MLALSPAHISVRQLRHETRLWSPPLVGRCTFKHMPARWFTFAHHKRRALHGPKPSSHTDPHRAGLHWSFPPICTSKPSGSLMWKLPGVSRTSNPRRFSSAPTASLTFLSVSQLAIV